MAERLADDVEIIGIVIVGMLVMFLAVFLWFLAVSPHP